MMQPLAILAQVPPIPPVPQAPAPPVIVTNVPDVILPPWMVMSAPAIVLSVFAICAAAAIILYPLVRALGRRLEGRGGEELQREVRELRERVMELEGGHARMAELEERLDFAERLLAQRREAEQLPRS